MRLPANTEEIIPLSNPIIRWKPPQSIKWVLYLFVLCNMSFYRNFSYLGVPVGSITIYVTELVLFFLILFFVFTYLIRPSYVVSKKTFQSWRPLWFFIGWSLFALFYSNYDDYLFLFREFASIYYSLFAILVVLTIKTTREFDKFVSVILVATSLSLVFIYFRFSIGQGHTTTTFGVYRYGNYETVGLLFLVFWLLVHPFNGKKIISWLKAVIIFFAVISIVVLIQHRSATIALFFSTGLFYYLGKEEHLKSKTAYLKIFLLIFCLIIISLFAQDVFHGTIDRLSTLRVGSEDQNITWRMATWLHAIQAMNILEYLIGKGWGAPLPIMSLFGRTYGEGEIMGMHNSLVFYFYHIGAIGLCLFLWLLTRIYYQAYKIAKLAPAICARQIRAILSANIGIIVFALFNVVLEGPYMGSVFWITLGMLWVKTNLVNNEIYEAIH